MPLTPVDFARLIGETASNIQADGAVLIGRESLMLRLVHAMQDSGSYSAEEFLAAYNAYDAGRKYNG